MQIEGIAVVQSHADLTVYGRNLDFESISRGIGVEASEKHRAGDRMHSRDPLPHDFWSLVTPLPRSEPLDAHLVWLQEAVSAHYAFLRSLASRANVVVHCWVQAFDASFAFSIVPEQMIMFTEIGVPWGISAILWGSDAEEEVVASSPQISDKTGRTAELSEPEYTVCTVHTRTSLYIVGESVDPVAIGRALNVEPRGPEDGPSFGESQGRGATNHFVLKSPLPLTDPLGKHLKWLLQIISPRQDLIGSLSRSAQVCILCDLVSMSDQCGFDVPPDVLEALVALRIPLRGSVSLSNGVAPHSK